MHGITKLSIFLAALAGVAANAHVARADLAPPPGFVESCTIQKQQKAGDECVSCSAYHGYQNHCADWLDGYGFTSRCHSRGASVWGEVWCRKKDANAKAVPPDVLAGLQNGTSHPPDAGAATVSVVPTATAPETPTAIATPPLPPTGTAPVASAGSTTTPDTTGAAPSPPAVEPKAGGCGACNAGGSGLPLGGALLAGAAALAFVTRRRRG